MTQISDDDITYLARLSKFTLSNDQRQALKSDLESILTHVTQLDDVDVDGIEPTAQVTGLKNVMRNDEERSYQATPDDLLNATHDQEHGQIKVKKVL